MTNLNNRGLDFAALTIEFFEASIVVPAKDGRFKAIGEFEGSVLAVIFKPLGAEAIAVIFKPLGAEAIAVISMRHASRKERNIHDKA